MSKHHNKSLPPLPKMGLEGLKENWRSDLPAGFAVFLTALPLCLAIALASGFPPSAGIITAIIGGVLVSRFNGSHITINGPAAGLIVVVFAAVQSLGEGDAMAGYRYTLAAIVIASIFQVLMGLYKVGRFSSFFPTAVVHGMLTAIGIIIMAKQAHVMLGVTPEAGNIFSTIAQIPSSLIKPTPEIALIGLSGLIVMVFWPLIKSKTLKKVPAAIVVLFFGMILGQILGVQHEHLHLTSPVVEHEHLIPSHFLVQLPDNFIDSFYFPDFSKILTLDFWGAVISICLVGSLESMLSTTAVDKLDPYKRKSDLNRDLTAIGFGNILAGFIGGLPMIAEIVRSTTNLKNGAKTGWANFFHGSILLVFVFLFPHFIHNIPLASLAVLLVYTGYHLASPTAFKKIFEIGLDQFAVFIITIISVLATDLLIGVTIGIIAKLLIHLLRGVWFDNLFRIHFTIEEPDSRTIVIKLVGSALFSNSLPLRKALSELETGKTIVFNFSNGYLIDHTVMEYIHEFSHDYTAQGGCCHEVGQALQTFSNHQLAARLMTLDERKVNAN
ncbi:MAG: SulP family inorganic anion transporter [Methylococcaceae bacterium]|nr:SulP family inorganic anion transporter [Methylococcaceae bacterium]